jgi:geranylgeranyl reductase
MSDVFDVIIVGGGPAGATAAHDLARTGRKVMLLDRAGRIKPCGGAIPPRLIRDFEIPDHLLKAKVGAARLSAPARTAVDMPLHAGGFVGMVDRDSFDEWLRERACSAGAHRRTGAFEVYDRADDGLSIVTWRDKADALQSARARVVIGADGANSAVARAALPPSGRAPFVFAYHEIIRTPAPADAAGLSPTRCDVYYQSEVSPDFYGWVFPHGDSISVGTGSARKGFSLRHAVSRLRQQCGLEQAETIRREGAPLPLYPAKRWDNGRDVILAGDAAGVVAPASGEGLYYAMLSGRFAADACHAMLMTDNPRALATARKRFMKEHGRIFLVLWIMQTFWYRSDRLREVFVRICKDPDVQRLTWESYMNKALVKHDWKAHLRVFVKDLGHILGLARSA